MAKKQTDGNLALEQQRVIVIPAHDEIIARKTARRGVCSRQLLQ